MLLLVARRKKALCQTSHSGLVQDTLDLLIVKTLALFTHLLDMGGLCEAGKW